MATLTNGLYDLNRLFDDNFFVIPDFQRGYAWGDQQVDEFWKDLELLHDGARHYAGQLILEAATEGDRNTYYVVDGQQRLTTCFLALKAAVDVLDKVQDDSLENRNLRKLTVQMTDLFHYKSSKGLRQYKLRYADGNATNTYLAGSIFNDPRHHAHASGVRTLYTENIRHAYEFFREKLAAQPISGIRETIKRITESLLCNVFCVTSDFDIHVAFETINNRGRDLSRLELLKNRLIYLTTVFDGMPGLGQAHAADLRAEVNQSWSTIYKWLGHDPKRPLDDDEFLTTHWIAYFGYEQSEANAIKVSLFDQYFTARRVREGELTIEHVQRYLRSLAQGAAVWQYLHAPEPYLPNQCVLWLERIEHLRWSSFKPLLLAAFLRLAHDERRVVTNPPEVHRCIEAVIPLLKQVERYIFMVYYMAERRGHTGRSQLYSTAASICPDGLNAALGESASADLGWAARRVGALNDNGTGSPRRHSQASDGESDSWEGHFDLADFADNVQKRLSRGTGFYNWDFTKVVLFEYERFLQGRHKSPKVTWKHVSNESIEHIYPQTPSDQYWQQRFPFDGRQARKKSMWQNSLGNLLLLSRHVNSSVGNDAFPKKLIAYKQGSFSETEVASDYGHWTKKNITDRGTKILEFVAERWDVRFADYGIKHKDCLVVAELAKA